MKNTKNIYKRKPELVEAIQFTGENIEECRKFANQKFVAYEFDDYKENQYFIRLDSGLYHLNPSDFILKSLETKGYQVKSAQEFLEEYQLK